MLWPIARSIPPCLPCLAASPKTVSQCCSAMPCTEYPPSSTNSVPSLPACKCFGQYQESQVAHAGNQNSDPPRTPGHDRHPQGLLKQPEPSACSVTVYPAPDAAHRAVLFAAAYPPGGRHIAQLGPGKSVQPLGRRAAPSPHVIFSVKCAPSPRVGANCP